MNYLKNCILFKGGMELHTFTSYRYKTRIDNTGAQTKDYDYSNPICKFYGAISRASQKEIEYHKQLGHPISHEIIAYDPVPVKPEDVIAAGDRIFYVHDVRDPGELGIVYCIFTEEKPALPRPKSKISSDEELEGFFY